MDRHRFQVFEYCFDFNRFISRRPLFLHHHRPFFFHDHLDFLEYVENAIFLFSYLRCSFIFNLFLFLTSHILTLTTFFIICVGDFGQAINLMVSVYHMQWSYFYIKLQKL